MRVGGRGVLLHAGEREAAQMHVSLKGSLNISGLEGNLTENRKILKLSCSYRLRRPQIVHACSYAMSRSFEASSFLV